MSPIVVFGFGIIAPCPCLIDLAPGQADALTRGALAVLTTAAGATLTQAQSTHWQSKWTDLAIVPDTTCQLTEPTQWQTLDRTDAAQFSGRLVGGCIDTLGHLCCPILLLA